MIPSDSEIQRLTGHLVLVTREDLLGLILSRVLKDRNKPILVYLFAPVICFINKEHHRWEKHALKQGQGSPLASIRSLVNSLEQPFFSHVISIVSCNHTITIVLIQLQFIFVTITTSVLLNTDLLYKWKETKQLL